MDEKTVEKFQSHRKKYQSFLKAMNCCPLCSSPLVLVHEICKEDHIIKETAHCDHCEVQTRRKDHIRH